MLNMCILVGDGDWFNGQMSYVLMVLLLDLDLLYIVNLLSF